MANEQIQMVMIAVTDMAKAKAFYAEQLGFQVTGKILRKLHPNSLLLARSA